MYVYNEGAGEMGFARSAKNSIEEIYGHTPEVMLVVCDVAVGGFLVAFCTTLASTSGFSKF
jgi:hypothetical protein